MLTINFLNEDLHLSIHTISYSTTTYSLASGIHISVSHKLMKHFVTAPYHNPFTIIVMSSTFTNIL